MTKLTGNSRANPTPTHGPPGAYPGREDYQMDEKSTMPAYLTDDEMQTLVDCKLYAFDGDEDQFAIPNYRYCQPSTPRYQFDFDEQAWTMER